MQKVVTNDSGFILVAVLVTLMLLVVIGFSATTTTTVELQIAGNDKVSKKTFYGADGGTDLGTRMVEENVGCPNGFTATTVGNVGVEPSSLTFGKNTVAKDPITDNSRDLFYPQNYVGNQPHTNISIGGPTLSIAGSAIQMNAGYERMGKSSAAGGSYIRFNIISQRIGENNSQAEVQLVWRHIVGEEGDCNY